MEKKSLELFTFLCFFISNIALMDHSITMRQDKLDETTIWTMNSTVSQFFCNFSHGEIFFGSSKQLMRTSTNFGCFISVKKFQWIHLDPWISSKKAIKCLNATKVTFHVLNNFYVGNSAAKKNKNCLHHWEALCSPEPKFTKGLTIFLLWDKNCVASTLIGLQQ